MVEQDSNGSGEQQLAGRRPEFRVADGGIIREGNLVQDITPVLAIYKSPHAISQLADVTPDDTEEQTVGYYFVNPRAKLFVAPLRDGRVVGGMTVTPEDGLRSAKFNRLVVAEDQQDKEIAHQLVRQGLSYAFSPTEAGGLGASQVIVAVIQSLPGTARATAVFERFGFDYFGPRLENRCVSWDPAIGGLVLRDVRQLLLQRSNYVMRYGSDLAKPPTAPFSTSTSPSAK